jgi:TPP-dependent pyruvate/acetoin dehydrogenase alpha subunit
MEILTKQELIDFEDEIKALYLDAQIRSPVHLSKGNEDKLIEVFKEVGYEDWVFSTHRSHYHALLKGIPRSIVKKEIMENRSIHLNDKSHKFFTSAIVGGVLPIAVGVAMGIKRKKGKERVWVFVGDMCSEMGVFHECVKYAKKQGLPINFVIEDNGLSVETPTQKTWGEEEFDNVRVIKYKYERGYPHHGAGQWVSF